LCPAALARTLTEVPAAKQPGGVSQPELLSISTKRESSKRLIKSCVYVEVAHAALSSSTMATTSGSDDLPPWIYAVSGSASVVIANSLLYPIDR
jgi:hypothetical protein